MIEFKSMKILCDVVRGSVVATALLACLTASRPGFAADVTNTVKSSTSYSNDEHYTDSYLFELIYPGITFGNKQNQYDAKFTHAFKKLISPYFAIDKRFFLRITSGPSAKDKC